MTAERINQLLVCLPDSGLPADLQAWLRELFSRQPDYVDLDQRDELIRAIIKLSPGQSATAQCCVFLDALTGRKQHPSATADRLISKLRATGATVPQSTKQLLRILGNRRQDGWAAADLCPLRSLHHSSENAEDTHNERRKRN